MKKNFKNNKKAKKVIRDSGFKLAENVSNIKESNYPLSHKVIAAYNSTISDEMVFLAKRNSNHTELEGQYCPKVKPGTSWAYALREKNAKN